uniref:Uncharacterized protein n=1 Tax=Lepeophtheirus salmonis TaxID=72036 RepID=A0A0K2SYW3_LEPSM
MNTRVLKNVMIDLFREYKGDTIPHHSHPVCSPNKVEAFFHSHIFYT